MNPYLIQGPAQISFSGGRSSAMMLCKILEAHGGTLPDDVVVLFANTGKERDETLAFVDQVQRHLGIAVHWLEYRPEADARMDRWVEVDLESASRQGEPFHAMTVKESRLPSNIVRICTHNLKIKPMQGFMRRLGYKENEYSTVVGIRADEHRRVAKMRGREDTDFRLPLAEAGETHEDVIDFWDAMPFDLALPTINGRTVAGNCDLCYLKGQNTLIGLIRENPARADWWIKLETDTGNKFRGDRPDFATLKRVAMRPGLFDDAPDEESLPCECTD